MLPDGGLYHRLADAPQSFSSSNTRKESWMTFKDKWNKLPQWIQVTVYTVLGLAAIGGVGYLGFRLIQSLLQGTGAQGTAVWPVLGGLALISIVFGGFGRGRRRREKRAFRDEQQAPDNME